MSKQPSKLFITLAILGGIFAVSTSSIFIKFANQEASSVVIAAYRLILAVIILAPIAITRYKQELRNLSKREVFLGLLSGFFLALHFATWISSLEYTSVASSVVLVTTTPLWVALLSPVILKEPSSKAVTIGMFLSLIGGVIIGLSDSCTLNNGLVCPPLSTFIQGQAFWGDILALCGALMAAGYIMIGRQLRAKMSLIPYIFVVYGMAAIVLLFILLSSHQQIIGYTPAIYVWLLLLAIIPQLIGHTTFNWALRFLPASLVSITLLGEPIGSTILAYIILRESPTMLKIIGALIIFIGIYIASSKQEKEQLQEEILSNE